MKTIGKGSGVLLLFLIVLFLITPLPQPVFDVPYATTLRAENGTLLSAAIASDHQWRFPKSDSIPHKFQVSLRLFEDEYFHYHPGVNPVSLFRAWRQNIKAGNIRSGGSTITMQTIRMALGNQNRTYGQKIAEMATALKLDLLYSKSSILKLYADHAPFGGNIVGINAASWRYYGRPPHLLSWSEAATLAILPNNPASIFPGKNHDAFLAKRNRLLNKLHDRGYLDKDELFMAKEEPLPKEIKTIPQDAYHLLHRAMDEGLEGTEVPTTLDEKLQLSANRIVNDYSKSLSYNQIQNAAAVIINIKSGNTLAYVGNSTSNGDHGQYVDIITSRRSPGSLLKPFLYALALDDGLIAPNQLLPDIPIFYKGFAPKNFDKKYRGAVFANEALTSSLNVPFVHLLINYGYEKFHHKLLQMGFNSIDRPASHYGLSMILGGAETTLWELTSVYASMARAYQHYSNRPYQSGYSSHDYHSNRYIKEALPAPSDFTANGLMQAPSIRFALEAMQEVNRPHEEAGWRQFSSSKTIAWKTGTSYGFRDGWAIGLNNDYLVGVWVGNADGEGRPGLTGVVAAAPLLFQLFGLVDGDSDLGHPFGPDQVICANSGMIANKNCPETYAKQLPDYLLNSKSCQFHTIVHLNEEETHQVNSSCYHVSKIRSKPWFVLPPVQAWYYNKYHTNYAKLPAYLPSCRQSSSGAHLELIYPSQFTKVKIPLEQDGNKGLAIFEAAHQNSTATIYWHLDDQYLGQTTNNHQKGIQAPNGPHTLTLVDDFGNELIQRFEVVD